MIIITDAQTYARVLNAPLDSTLKNLLMLRRDQLVAGTDCAYDIGELAHFLIVEPHDEISDIEAAIGTPLVDDPPFEWVADHGGWFEAVVILSDDGFGIVLLVPDRPDIDATLLAVLRSKITFTRQIVRADDQPEQPSAF